MHICLPVTGGRGALVISNSFQDHACTREVIQQNGLAGMMQRIRGIWQPLPSLGANQLLPVALLGADADDSALDKLASEVPERGDAKRGKTR